MTADDELLLRLIRENARNTGFFELVRLIEQVTGPRFAQALELTHEPDLTFPVSDVVRAIVEPSNDGERIRLVCTFLGLTGAASPLATHFTEQVLHHDDEDALRTFYDVFHDLLLRMLYHSWRSASLKAALDETGESAMSMRCATFVGVDPWMKPSGESLPTVTMTGLADYQRGRPQSIDGLSATAMLRRLLPTLPLEVTLGHQRFVPFSDDDVAELGEQNISLGDDLVYGAGCDDASATARVVVGPVHYAVCDWLMPAQAGYVALRKACERVFGSKAHVELEVLVDAAEVPACELGGEVGAELGVDTLVSSRPAHALRIRVPLTENALITQRTYVHSP